MGTGDSTEANWVRGRGEGEAGAAHVEVAGKSAERWEQHV
jgi:hypothetical protein